MLLRESATLAVLVLAQSLGVAYAETRVRIVDVDPPRSATLGVSQSLYVRIEYTSDEPVNLWARPYAGGELVGNAIHNASEKYEGSGEALGWFALTVPGFVDEVRIVAGGGDPWRESIVASRSLDVRWTRASGAEAPRAEWVDELRRAQNERDMAAAQARAAEPTTPGELVFFNGFMLLVLGLIVAGIGVPLRCVRQWHGAWRAAAAVAAGIMGFVVLRILVGTAIDPTSHNLWPFEILMAGLAALAIVGVLKVLRRFAGVV